LIGVPVNGVLTLWALPSSLLLRDPGVNADFLLAPDVVHHFMVVIEFVAVEVDDKLAGKIGAFCATGQSLLNSAITEYTVAASSR